MRLDRCVAVALSFLRTYVDCPETPLGVGFQGREAIGPGGCFLFWFFPGCFSDSHECLLGTLCLKGLGLSSEMHFLKSKSKSSKCEGEGQHRDPIGGGFNRFVTGSLRALGESCYLTVVSASSQPNRGASRAPGAPSHLGHPAAILGKSSNPCWSALTVGGTFESPSLLLSPHAFTPRKVTSS